MPLAGAVSFAVPGLPCWLPGLVLVAAVVAWLLLAGAVGAGVLLWHWKRASQ